jgi:hypothetical protein
MTPRVLNAGEKAYIPLIKHPLSYIQPITPFISILIYSLSTRSIPSCSHCPIINPLRILVLPSMESGHDLHIHLPTHPIPSYRTLKPPLSKPLRARDQTRTPSESKDKRVMVYCVSKQVRRDRAHKGESNKQKLIRDWDSYAWL